MGQNSAKIIALTVGEIFETLSDLIILPFFSASQFYNLSQETILKNQDIRKSNFSRKIYDLKRRGYINSFIKDKEVYFEITPKGKNRIKKQKLNKLVISQPLKWDGRWRIIIFDIPEKYRYSRDAFRRALTNLNFVQIQKSVYVHPFECAEQIKFLSNLLCLDQYVKITISEIIQGEEDIIAEFLDKKVLNMKDIRVKK